MQYTVGFLGKFYDYCKIENIETFLSIKALSIKVWHNVGLNEEGF